MMWGYGFGWGDMLLMIVSMLLGVLVIGLLLWAIVRWLVTHTPSGTVTLTGPAGPSPSALEILRQRYARGEIDATTYDQMRERLEGGGSPTRELLTSR